MGDECTGKRWGGVDGEKIRDKLGEAGKDLKQRLEKTNERMNLEVETDGCGTCMVFVNGNVKNLKSKRSYCGKQRGNSEATRPDIIVTKCGAQNTEGESLNGNKESKQMKKDEK